MKKLVILALSAVMVMSVSAQEQQREFEKKKLTKEERVEMDIKRLTNELMLSDQQAEKFAVTFREYAAKRAELFEKTAPKEKGQPKELTDEELDKLAKKRLEAKKKAVELDEQYYAKFRKDLSARQVAKVLRLDGPCKPKPECAGPKVCREHGHGHIPVFAPDAPSK